MVSVIVPTYNCAKYLGGALDSVMGQDVESLEVIVVDDGSTDSTPELLASIVDPRIRVIRTTNHGVSHARNVGIESARGQYIAFLDADDRWRPGMLRNLMRVMNHDPEIGAVFCNFVRFDEEGYFPLDQFQFYPELGQIATADLDVPHARRIVGNAFCSLVPFGEFPAWVQTLLIRRSVIGEVRFPSGRTPSKRRYALCEDAYFCMRVYRATQVAFVREPFVEVRRHGENTTCNTDDMPHAKLAALRLLEELDLSAAERLVLRRRVGRAAVDSARTLVSEGLLAEAFGMFMLALSRPGYRLSALAHLSQVPFGLLRRTKSRRWLPLRK